MSEEDLDSTTALKPGGRRIRDPLELKEDDPLPPLRALQVQQLQIPKAQQKAMGGDEIVFVAVDPEGWAPNPVPLSPSAFAVAMLFDGDRTAAQVAEEHKKRYDEEIESKQVMYLAREIDKHLLLASPRFQETLRCAILKYLAEPVRPANFSGDAYPEDPAELMTVVEGFFTDKDGPGVLPPKDLAAEHAIRGMILPHIDLRVGGPTYAHGYQALLEATQAELFVILGVAHRGMAEVMFHVSTKDQATPWGPVKNFKAMAERLQKAAGVEPALAEFAHRTEHSVEFQVVLLEALYRQRAGRDYQILPILCGPSDEFVEQQKNPMQDERFMQFVNALRTELDNCGKKWCVIASVDLSHVGPKFDHRGNQMSTAMNERTLLPIERMDRRILAPLVNLDPAAFFAEITRTQNSRNIDAVMAAMVLLTMGKGLFKEGKLIHYDIMLETPTKSAVSYAALSFK